MPNGLLPLEKAEFARQGPHVEVPSGLSLRVDCIAVPITDSGQTTSKKTRASREERNVPPGRARANQRQYVGLTVISLGIHHLWFCGNIAIIPWCELMNGLLHRSVASCGLLRRQCLASLCAFVITFCCVSRVTAQDDPLNKVHVPPPSTTAAPT